MIVINVETSPHLVGGGDWNEGSVCLAAAAAAGEDGFQRGKDRWHLARSIQWLAREFAEG